MYNDILTIGPVTVHGYGLMIAIGILCALFVGLRLSTKKGLDKDQIYNLTFIAAIGGFLCGKILFCIVEYKAFIENPLNTLGSGGFIVYGGIIGGTLLCGLYTKIKGLSFLRYFDIVLPSVAIAQGFGRIGCFLAGCCYGRETDSPIGIAFHNSDFAPNNVPLIPIQLFSSAACFALAAILIFYLRKERRPGSSGALYLILYSAGRFVIEFFRNDYRGSVGPFSTSQFISIFIFVLGALIFTLSQTGRLGKLEQ